SYASVVSGSAPGGAQPQFASPGRSGTFAQSGFMRDNSTSLPHPYHGPTHHTRNFSRDGEADGHYDVMSTSWGRAGPAPSYSNQSTYFNPYREAERDGSTPFFVPSYMKGSRYAERLEEAAYKAKAKEREYRLSSSNTSIAGSLSTSSSSVNLHNMSSSHRGLAHKVIERVPVGIEESMVPWPTRWSETDRYPQLDIQGGGLEARFSGLQKVHEEGASVRADYPMPRQCGIYYFEVTVVSKTKEGRQIGVGFSGPKVPLSRIPGWEPESFAYHGDDGQCFTNTTTGKLYGPKFGSSDVIGCGINFRTATAFFTKNGVNLGIAFRDLKTDRKWFPTVGMKKPGEILRANFGQEPFVFDIDSMVEAEKASVHSEISKFKPIIPEESNGKTETTIIHDLISQYLVHDGYVETSKAFADEVEEASNLRHLTAEDNQDAVNRQKIRTAILEGDIDKALKHTMAYYPSVLRDNQNIYFKLRCRKFIEMMRLSADMQEAPSKRAAANGHGAPDTYNVFEHQMELDEQFGDTMDTEEQASRFNRNDDFQYTKLMNETLKYGQELKSEFSGDQSKAVRQALNDTFALVAYQDARESSLAPLLEESGRVPVVEELNGAILVSQGKSPTAAIEQLFQQTEALVNELAEDGREGAFINVRRDFMK
ncbi:Ran-binding protein-like protein, partial [Delitschia confertaspora ATCC 74209]